MPNAVKYKTGNLTGSLQKGNVALGISGSLGPTSTTGWYNGPNPVTGKYQIFETAASGDPDVYCPQDDAELIKFARWKGATGADTGSAAAVLAWIGTQTNLMAANFQYEGIVTDGLVLNIDAGFVGSYPTTGTTGYDLSGNSNNGTLTNGPTFNSANSGSIVFDGVDDSIQLGKTAAQLGFANASFSVSIWFNSSNTGNDSPLFSTNGGGANTWLHYNLRGGFLHMGFYGNDVNGGSVSNNVTYCATFIYDISGSGTQSIYRNDVLVASTPNHAALQSLNTFQIGGVYGGAYVGKIYQVLAYNKALSSTEVLQNFNAQKGRFGL
jgi:hypothetical protein